MNTRLGTIAHWGWLAITAATLGCQADNRVGLEPDGGAGASKNGGAGSSNPGPTGASISYSALAYTWAPPAHVTVAGQGGITWFDQVTGAKLRTVDPGSQGATLVRDVGDVMAASLLGNLWIFDTGSNVPRTIKHDSEILSL
ncbi:MAG TPA: hypothetical protein VK989_18700, partial [Polyangia bacterium]|nr:hypothetical protein [Polyangia bacterium]